MQIPTLICPLIGYLLGSLPFALWITRIAKGIDVRAGGSGHVTATNTIRQAGWLPGVLVAILDISKGFIPAYLALKAGLPDWAVALTTTLTVVGHCWPIFAGFRGGMGLATSGGILLAVSLIGFLVAFALLLICVLVVRHSARGAVVAALIGPFVFWIFGLHGTQLWVGVGIAIVIAVRFYLEDWNRKYRELWLDRNDQKTSE